MLCHQYTDFILLCSPSIQHASDLPATQNSYPVTQFQKDIQIFNHTDDSHTLFLLFI